MKNVKITPDNIKTVAKSVLPAADIDTYRSDLYLRVTPESKKLVNQMLEDNGYHKDNPLCSLFTDQIDGDRWYDLAFCNMADAIEADKQDSEEFVGLLKDLHEKQNNKEEK